jgi:hypothetical protein
MPVIVDAVDLARPICSDVHEISGSETPGQLICTAVRHRLVVRKLKAEVVSRVVQQNIRAFSDRLVSVQFPLRIILGQ